MAVFKIDSEFVQESLANSVIKLFREELKNQVMEFIEKEIDKIVEEVTTDFISRVRQYERYEDYKTVFVVQVDGVEKIKKSVSKNTGS